ncbi:zinc-ribbon domain-containing protein [Microbacterium hibisci]|uniref:zinc-ribbon domain-containing protein n=1 Tax=Microbacterium hibisci TaxID=2036000 RepID=UPI0019439347|nr:zinc-ribbon domain-containing protein [Microbacterium hibisci]
MAERVELWWARRQFSKGAEVPYPVGSYRSAWASYPALVRQYHPELNAGITLTQIPPAADVLLLWECEAGHRFAATPSEQRARPGRERRRSAWCPECSVLARPPRASLAVPTVAAPAVPVPAVAAPAVAAPTPPAPPGAAPRRRRPTRRLCGKTPDLPVGEAFLSACAPKPASAAEARLRADLFERLAVTPGLNAIRTSRPFFDHLEVWPDILLPELRIAVEYDTVGKHGLEHVGRREEADRRKDRALRASGWEVVRLRMGKLEPLGPFDLQLASWTKTGRARLLDVFREIRGSLLIDAYVR